MLGPVQFCSQECRGDNGLLRWESQKCDLSFIPYPNYGAVPSSSPDTLTAIDLFVYTQFIVPLDPVGPLT